MASQFLPPHQVFHSPLQFTAPNIPLFSNVNHRSSYNVPHITSNNTTQAGKQSPLNTSNPSQTTLKYGFTIQEICSSSTQLEIKEDLAKTLENRIRILSSSDNKNWKFDINEAKTLLNSMLENGLKPNVDIFMMLIQYFCKKGRMKKAFEIFELMNQSGIKPTVQVYNFLLKGLCYVGKVEEAYDMLMNMKKNMIPMKPDIYSYSVVMDGLCKVGRSDEAMRLLKEAEELMGLKPNVVTFNTLLQGYSREGRPLKGIYVMEMMRRKDCVPDYVCYATLLHGLLKWNEVSEALRVYKEMERLGFEVDGRMMGTLARRLCRESRNGKGKGMLEDACQVFEKMTKRDSIVIDQRTYEVMMQALCDQGRTEEAVSTLVLMDENGRIPSGLCFDELIKELNAQGRLCSHSNLLGYAIKRGGGVFKSIFL